MGHILVIGGDNEGTTRLYIIISAHSMPDGRKIFSFAGHGPRDPRGRDHLRSSYGAMDARRTRGRLPGFGSWPGIRACPAVSAHVLASPPKILFVGFCLGISSCLAAGPPVDGGLPENRQPARAMYRALRCTQQARHGGIPPRPWPLRPTTRRLGTFFHDFCPCMGENPKRGGALHARVRFFGGKRPEWRPSATACINGGACQRGKIHFETGFIMQRQGRHSISSRIGRGDRRPGARTISQNSKPRPLEFSKRLPGIQPKYILNRLSFDGFKNIK